MLELQACCAAGASAAHAPRVSAAARACECLEVLTRLSWSCDDVRGLLAESGELLTSLLETRPDSAVGSGSGGMVIENDSFTVVTCQLCVCERVFVCVCLRVCEYACVCVCWLLSHLGKWLGNSLFTNKAGKDECKWWVVVGMDWV